MPENEAFEDETDFGGVEVQSTKDEVEITVEQKLEDGEIPEPYAGMPAEVLLLHSRKKGWVIGRMIGWIAVIVAFGTLIGLSVTIIVKSPACLEFWEKSPIYQVYPRSFKDCDAEEWPDRVAESKDNPDRPNICGDGIGDLLGLIQKLDYLDELGIKVIWINPIYLSPQRDFGYDVSDYYHIDPQFGTDEDIELLIVEMHKRGMKLLMDFVPNHTSIEHKLFTDSVNRTVGSEDNYIWVDGDKPEGCALIETEGIDKGLPNEACSSCADNCPNNWQSVFAKNDKTILPAWTYHPVRDQYYYRAFSSFQPDLNLRNPAVEEELQNIIAYWLDKGVDGFRVDAVGYAYENEDLRNEVKKDESEAGYWSNLYHDFTYEVGTFHDLLLGFRKVMESYSTEPGVDRMMITEATSFRTVADLMRYYGIYGQNEADFPMNFGLMELGMFGNDGSVNSELINKTISDWMEAMPEGRVPNWIISSHDESRILSRHADLKLDKENQKRLAKSFALLLMTLPGTPFVYYGQELGMIDLTPEDHPTECQVDVQEDSRDKNRSPMRWNSTAQYAGFSDCSASPEQSGSCPSCPWLPVGADQTFYDIQEKDKESVFKYYQWLIKDIRLEDEFTRGQFCLSANKNYKPEDQLQNYFRRLENGDIYEIIINWSGKEHDLVGDGELLAPPGAAKPDSNKIQPYSGLIKRHTKGNSVDDFGACYQRRDLKIGLGGIVFTK